MSDAGAPYESASWPEADSDGSTSVMFVGADAVPTGVADADAVPGVPKPRALYAVTRKIYGTPFVRPEAVADVALLLVFAIAVCHAVGEAAGAYSTL